MTFRIFGSSTPPKSESQIKTNASASAKDGDRDGDRDGDKDRDRDRDSDKDKDKERVRQHLGPNALKTDAGMERFLDKLQKGGIPTTDGVAVKALYEKRYRRSEQIGQKQLSSGEVKQARRTNKEERPQNKKSVVSTPRPMKKESTASTPRQVRQARRPKRGVAAAQAEAPTSWFDDFSKGSRT